MRAGWLRVGVLSLLLSGCLASDGLHGTQRDAGRDAELPDASQVDPDASEPDASVPDASSPDAGDEDGGLTAPKPVQGTALSPAATVMSSRRFRLSTALADEGSVVPSRSSRFRLEPAVLRAE